jgi:hypothetical protein
MPEFGEIAATGRSPSAMPDQATVRSPDSSPPSTIFMPRTAGVS